VVGPGIAEALVATAVGLLAAIPATIAYNAFGGRIDAVLAMLERFSSQFEEDVSRVVQSPSGGASVAPAQTVSTTDIPAGRG
jgi:biopolymer transport protein TolQ